MFLLNALVFVLIGLQLPMILRGLDRPWPTVVDGVFAAFGAMVLVRLIWVFPGAYLPRYRGALPEDASVPALAGRDDRGLGRNARRRFARGRALASARPRGRKPVSGAQLLVFLTFSVILGSLVIQGLTLPPLIRWLRVAEDRTAEREERAARAR